MTDTLEMKVEGGALNGYKYLLYEGEYLLGRAPECAISFGPTQDLMVSGRHAVLRRTDGEWTIEDLQSRNGTYLNGERVIRAVIHSGDILELGLNGPHLHFSAIEKPAPVSSPLPSPSAPGWINQTVTGFGIYRPERERSRNLVGLWFGVVFTVFLGLITFAIITIELGFTGTLIGGFMAFLPAPFYLFLYLWMDRYDPEPGWALASAYAWGGIVSIFGSLITQLTLEFITEASSGLSVSDSVSTVILAPVVEETFKGLGVILLWLVLRTEFDDVLDGIVYAGVIALGFATVENVLYYGQAFLKGGASGLMILVILRGLMSPFSHAMFTSMTGIGCGLARESHSPSKQVLFPALGLLGAMTLHAAWNAIATISDSLFLVLYLVVWVPLFAAFVLVQFLLLLREGRIMRAMLKPEVQRGVLTESQYQTSTSYFRRLQWILKALPNFAKFNARRRFLRACARLAFSHWHVMRAQASHAYTVSLPSIPRFYEDLRDLKPLVE